MKGFLGLALRAGDVRQILLNLEDVSVESTSLGALKDALDEQCSELRPIFENNRMPRVMGRRVNIVAGVLKGRANTVFSHSGEMQVEAAVKNLADLLGNAAPTLKALAPELAASYGLSGRANVVAVSEQIQTVAYRPATIFYPGFSAKHTDEIQVEPFDPDNADHRELLGLQATSVGVAHRHRKVISDVLAVEFQRTGRREQSDPSSMFHVHPYSKHAGVCRS